MSTWRRSRYPKQDHVRSKDKKAIPGGEDIGRTCVQNKVPEDKV